MGLSQRSERLREVVKRTSSTESSIETDFHPETDGINVFELQATVVTDSGKVALEKIRMVLTTAGGVHESGGEHMMRCMQMLPQLLLLVMTTAKLLAFFPSQDSNHCDVMALLMFVRLS